MDYLKLLQDGYAQTSCIQKEMRPPPLEFLGGHIFGFITDDGEMSELFARKAVEVSDTISSRTNFAFIDDEENYRWYLLMCNMPFFASKLEYGTSIRGAWWDHSITFQSCGLWDGDNQMSDELTFSDDEWKMFIQAVSEFSRAATGVDQSVTTS